MYKKIYLTLSMCIAIGIFAWQGSETKYTVPESDLALSTSSEDTIRSQALAEGVDPDWYTAVTNKIAASEYFVRYQDQVGAYQSPNRAQNLRLTYYSDGYAVSPRVEEEDNWKAEIRLQNIGRLDHSDVLYPCEDAKIKTEENSLVADHGDFSIEYTNSEAGMRQDFRIKKRPEGSGNLRVNLKVDGDLQPFKKGNNAILLADQHPTRGDWDGKMWYKDLKVFDAEGTQLDAKMELKENLLALVVDDEEAVYPILVDPLNVNEDWSDLGGQAGAQFGYGIASVAKVARTNVSSVIVSAWAFDNGQVDEGRVYVYYGSPLGLSLTPDWQVESDQANALMGRSVSTAGDVDNDGFGDILIGCEFCGQNLEGQAFIWKGSSQGVNGGVNGVVFPLVSANDYWRGTGSGAQSGFGFSVACAGETNGDGLSDVIIGAPYDGNLQASEGMAYLYTNLTTNGTTANAAWMAESNDAGANFGHSVASAGDVNGDGTLDIIIGAPSYTNGEQNEGAVFLWNGNNLGTNGAPGNEDWFAESDWTSSFFGEIATTAGDVNGDGFSDVIVGSRRYNFNSPGRVFVWYGSATGLGVNGNPTNQDWHAEGTIFSRFGNSAACAGDVNGDGYSDIIVGASNFSNGQTGEGGAFLWLGGPGGLGPIGTIGASGNMDWSQESNQAGATSGWRVASAGDVNGDGFSDVIIGAPNFENANAQEGIAFVYHGCADGLSEISDWSDDSNSGTAQYGYIVSSAGDVNADGFGDVVIGAPYYDGGQTNEGMVQVYHGSINGLPASWNWWREGNVTGARFGNSVSCAGDNNADGFSDVIIGIPYHGGGGIARGRAEIYRGSASGLAATAIWFANGENDNDHFGQAVAGLGDIGEDGFSDVIVGAPAFDGATNNEGKVYVYYSDHCAKPYAAANWVGVNGVTNSQFGFSVSAGGRVEDGGAGSILVGAPYYNNGQSNEGAAYLWMGDGLPATGTSANVDFMAEANVVNSYMGVSVACAGDVNGDSYDDIIVGVDGYTNTQNLEGAAFLWEGSSTGLGANGNPGNADWSAFGGQAFAFYGLSVSCAGDVNGDGFDDVIVGAPFWESGSGDINEGRAYLYRGSGAGLSTAADWEYESDIANSWFGWAVSSAGDINGDGYDDVIIGSPRYESNTATPDEGLVYVFQGNSGGGLRSNTRQFQYGSSTVVGPGCLTDSDEEVRLAQFATHFLGRQDGKLFISSTEEGVPFQCGTAPLTNCLSQAQPSVAFTDLGVNGVQLTMDISGGIASNLVYEWRSRITYNLNTAITGQVAGPWRYQPNEHIHGGGFRAKLTPSIAGCKRGSSALEEEALASNEVTEVSVYPSPLIGGQTLKVDVELNQESKIEVRVSNTNGQILHRALTPLHTGMNHLELDTDNWPAGVYLIQLEGNGLNTYRKFVIL